MERPIAVVALTLFFLSVGLGLAAGGGAASMDAGQYGAIDEIDPDETILAIDVQADGTASWEISYRLHLDDQADIDAFEELQENIADDPDGYVERFIERFEPTVDDASAATDRDMSMENVTIDTDRRFIDREYGVVYYRFEWTQFGAVDDGDLFIGDAIAGVFLTEQTSLIISWPDGYGIVAVDPDPDAQEDQRLRWSGPREFGADQPSLHLSESPPADDDTNLLLYVVAGLLVVLLALVLLGWGYTRRGDDKSAQTAATESEEVDHELLSNEEQVLAVVEAHGGRMKQQAVADELEWTDAKTSKVVRQLREEGKLEGFRLGRENVLRLPEEDDTA